MLPAITDFFQTTFIDNITKFLQPTYITIASIFTVLNLLFIFPDLVSHNILFAVGLFSLSPVLQAVLILVIVLILAYLLLSASSAILTFMTGESWSRSLLGMFLRNLQVREWKRLSEESQKGLDDEVQPESGQPHLNSGTEAGSRVRSIQLLMAQVTDVLWKFFKKIAALVPRTEAITSKQGEQTVRRDIARLEKLTRFPQEEDHIGPTALGNILTATASYTWNHYKMDMAALWPHMEIAIVKANDTELKTRINNEKTALDFLVSLTFILGLFAIELILVKFCWLDHDLIELLGPIAALILAFIVYQAAVIKAQAWSSVVQLAFDTHRNDVKALLGVRDFSSGEDERNVWQKVSSLLLWNDEADDVFIGQPSVSVTSSSNVKVDTHASVFTVAHPQQELIKRINGTVCGIFYVYTYIHYVLLISNADASNNTGNLEGVHLLISDPRIVAIDTVPVPTSRKGIEFSAEVIHTTEPDKVDALLWSISGLKTNGSTALSYKLPLRLFRATIDNDLLIVAESFGTNTHRFILTNKGKEDAYDALLEVFDNYTSEQNFPDHGDLYIGDEETKSATIDPRDPEPHRYRWHIAKVPQGKSVKLIFSPKATEKST